MALKIYSKGFQIILDDGTKKEFIPAKDARMLVANGWASISDIGTPISKSNILANIEDEFGNGFATEALLIDYLSGIIGKTGSASAIGLADFDTDTGDIMGFVNGNIIDAINVDVTSDGVTSSLILEQNGGGDIRLIFSTGVHIFDTTPSVSIALTSGTDINPQSNYIYIPETTKAITVSTVGFPATEHVKIANVLCQSAASLQTEGAYKVHVWNDHIVSDIGQGHLGDLNYWIRRQHATWESGVAQTLTITTNGGAADNVIFTSASGIVLQLHDHVFPAFGGTPDLYVVNDSGAAYNVVTDLNQLLTDALGNTMSASRFSLVVWGAVSEDTGDCKLFINLPSGTYNSDDAVIADASKYANFTIPESFKGVGFLISELKLRHQTSGSGTWTSIEEVDLRGLKPSISAGSGGAAPTEFADNVFKVFNTLDATKELRFDLAGVTAASLRKLEITDRDGEIGLALKMQPIKSANFTALVGEKYIVDTLSGIVAITPPTPVVAGDRFAISDAKNNFATNNAQVKFTSIPQRLNGSNIDGVLSTNLGHAEFEYIDAAIGWVVVGGTL